MTAPAGRMLLLDRLRTIAVTAAVTSIAWLGVWLAAGGADLDGLAMVRTIDPAARAAPGDRDDNFARSAASGSSARPTGKPLDTELPRDLPPAAAGRYRIPVAGVTPGQLTDTFSDARGGGARVHEAIDIMAPTGTAVVAAAEGTVEKLFQSAAGGLTIYIRSPDRRTITYYAHLDAYAPGLAEGRQVRSGQALGAVGYSGNASPASPHLHFAILRTTPQARWYEPATAINPYPLLARR